MNPESIKELIEDLPGFCPRESSEDSGYALPSGSLALLRECISRLGVRSVFEFGTGRSTRLFLDAGCKVTAIEDSESWLSETVSQLGERSRASFTPYRLPLRLVWQSFAPMLSWSLPADALEALRLADFVLVDSPALPPFREHAFALALEHARCALIVVDDANIPTVTRFCRRLSKQNGAVFRQLTLDHGLFFSGPATLPFQGHRSMIETAKAWRRYFRSRCGA